MPISGGDPHALLVDRISSLFTFLGAFVFSTIRSKRARIPQEAIIGICYAVASAAAILAMSKATSESEHLKDMLVGNILAVSWPEVGKTALLYSAIGVFHYIFLQEVSRHLDGSQAGGRTGSQREVLGFFVLRVVWFCRDIVCGNRGSSARILLPDCALGRGHAVRGFDRQTAGDRLVDGDHRVSARRVPLCSSSTGPTGATIVCTFGLVLILMAAVRPLIQREKPGAVPQRSYADRAHGR